MSAQVEEMVVLVSPEGKPLGTLEKLAAHREGVLHSAFSVFIFNSEGEMLLQQRGLKKYHFAGKWSNACCSHPRWGEKVEDAATRRLQEEMGFVTALEPQYAFIYKTFDEESQLYEHELDHVFFGDYEGEILPDDYEVHAIRWISVPQLLEEVKSQPESFTFWFKEILAELLKRELLPVG